MRQFRNIQLVLASIFKKKKQRSVVFYNNSYYHFYYLAKALRKRGWDAISVSLEPEDGPNAMYCHGEDLNLYNKNPKKFNNNIKKFFRIAERRFNLMHFAGDGHLSFFPENYNNESPSDIIQWKRKHKIAYTISGCNSGTSKTSVSEWSIRENGLNVCDTCIWQDNETVCNDEKNLNWGRKVNRFCDLIFSETLPALDFMSSSDIVIREPVTMCLDELFWSPDIVIPKEHLVEKKPGEILIYHSVGNYDIRTLDSKNIKGTPFIIDAINKLKNEGYAVKLFFATNIPNKLVRYYQAQADIIVDQLNSGRYGANAREAMMLGKPVICYLNKFEYRDEDKLDCLEECPIVSANEKDIYDILKQLVIDSDKRDKLGKKSREYAIKWHSADSCAERYEKYYDKIFFNDCTTSS